MHGRALTKRSTTVRTAAITRSAALLAAFALACLAAAPALAAPSFARLGVPQPDRNAVPTAISADGTRVAGYLQVGSGFTAPSIGAAWDVSGSVTPLGDIPGGSMGGVANAISADGSIVVGKGTSDLRGDEAVLWDATDTLVRIHHNAPNANSFPGSEATAVSADGSVVVGSARFNPSLNFDRRAVRWDENGAIEILTPQPADVLGSWATDVSADGGKVAGYYRTNADTTLKAFVWDETNGSQDIPALQPVPDAPHRAVAISGDGDRVLVSATESGVGTFSGLSDSGGTPQLLPGVPGAPTSAFSATAMSEDGRTVGGRSQLDESTWGPVLWREGVGTRSLQGILDSLGVDTSGWELIDVTAVSGDGLTIAGTGYVDGNVYPTGWVAIIPEPGTALLVGVGLLAISRRHRGAC